MKIKIHIGSDQNTEELSDRIRNIIESITNKTCDVIKITGSSTKQTGNIKY